MGLIFENIFSTLAKECGKIVRLVMKFDNKKNWNYLDHPLWSLVCANNLEHIQQQKQSHLKKHDKSFIDY